MSNAVASRSFLPSGIMSDRALLDSLRIELDVELAERFTEFAQLPHVAARHEEVLAELAYSNVSPRSVGTAVVDGALVVDWIPMDYALRSAIENTPGLKEQAPARFGSLDLTVTIFCAEGPITTRRSNKVTGGSGLWHATTAECSEISDFSEGTLDVHAATYRGVMEEFNLDTQDLQAVLFSAELRKAGINFQIAVDARKFSFAELYHSAHAATDAWEWDAVELFSDVAHLGPAAFASWAPFDIFSTDPDDIFGPRPQAPTAFNWHPSAS